MWEEGAPFPVLQEYLKITLRILYSSSFIRHAYADVDVAFALPFLVFGWNTIAFLE